LAVVFTFSGWLSDDAIDDIGLGLALMFLALPVTVLVHELGHAAVGLLRTEGLVIVQIGGGPKWLRTRIGRLGLEVGPIPVYSGTAGSARTFAPLSRPDAVAYALAGPLAELLLLAACAPLVARAPDRVFAPLVCGWVIAVLHATSNLVPRRIAGHWTDGARLRAALRKRTLEPSSQPPPESTVAEFMNEFADTLSRWLVLVTNGSASFRTERRGATLVCAAWELGLSREKSPQVRAAFWHALAGWCWRDCEHGDPGRRRAAVEEVWRRKAQEGLVGRELDSAVAGELARDPDLGLGSPGRTDDERKGFLARAFRELRPPVDARALDEADRLFCFRYGVALHDVEHLAR
jgi:hypothetical protein